MVRKLRFLLHCSVFGLLPCATLASGTYYNYNGTVQRNYRAPSSANPGFVYGAANNMMPGCGTPNCGMNNANANVVAQQPKNVKKSVNREYVSNSDDDGLVLNAELSHQFASWKFDMKTAGSKLHYDNLAWNVLDADAKYDFNFGDNLWRVKGGVQYGKQYGDSTMVDDDVTGGGYFLQDWNVDLTGDNVSDQVWIQQGHALSVGTSSNGTMLGLYAGLGLVDAWKFGNVRMTPSVGYRYFKYKLETKRNYGMSMDTVSGATNYCQTIGSETQCLPFVVFTTSANKPLLGVINAVDFNEDGVIDTVSYISVPDGAAYLETENTYYYYQDGVSHSYEVEWAGPYLALDVDYDVTPDDSVNARVELGLPAYTATADQPYRPDWQHPKSLEDTAGIGDAFHFGFGANWYHALSESVNLTLGATFDYYHVSEADATSYLNPEYYTTNYLNPATAYVNNATNTTAYNTAVSANQALINSYGGVMSGWSEADVNTYNNNLRNVIVPYEDCLETIDAIDSLRSAGWKQEVKGEIESLYKSIGIRLGIVAKF